MSIVRYQDENAYLEQLRVLWEKNRPSFLPKEPRYAFGEVPLTEYLRNWAMRTPEKPCIIFYGKELTFRQLDELSSRFAALLASRGLEKGDRVAVFLPNCPQFLIVFYGILKLGCIHVPINPMFRAQELLYVLQDTEAKVIVTLDQLYPIVQEVREKTSLVEVMITRFQDFLPNQPSITVHPSMLAPPVDCPGSTDLMQALSTQNTEYPDNSVGLDDVAALNYTGGTTGMPKGCAHTQRNMLYTSATAATFCFQLTSEDVTLGYLPVFWIAGEDFGVLLPVFNGSTHILLARWDAKAMLEAIHLYRPTLTGGVLDNFVELMEHPDVASYDLTSLKDTFVSSFIKKLNVDYRRRWKELAGCIMREAAYGMTETHTVDTYTTGFQDGDKDLLGRPVFCGLPMPGTEIKIVDFETRQLVPLGQEGEIAIRTPSLFKYYWNKPEETKNSLQDGWLYTGDIGMLDEEGCLHYLGRRKEMLKVKGMSVFPSELEIMICNHPAVEGCGVIGVPDEEKGEMPVAFVKLRPEFVGKVSEKELEDWCRDNMATYKVPNIKILEQFPMTATGKIKKEELRKMA